ncbi:NPCBM/NEW2 domain-containing protein [Streptomyces macrosporus]|uniref:NPCBM/NEW2 domain-containing protein n=1 Tax=Streptomyces macrosporus TaxID=44032 RepID=UPI0031D957CA
MSVDRREESAGSEDAEEAGVPGRIAPGTGPARAEPAWAASARPEIPPEATSGSVSGAVPEAVPSRWVESSRRAEAEERPPGDTELISRMRGGDTRAYEELYRRHADAVLRYVRHCCRDEATANDLTDEVFARTLLAVRGGAGPDTAVRVHLLGAVRQVAAAWGRTAGWEQLAEGFAVFAVAADSSGSGDSFESDADVRAMRKAERSTVVRAFRGLPERWQVVLWHTVVEGESPREVAPSLGLTADATAMLAYRAKEGLRQAYLQAHVDRSRTAAGDCARHVDRLGTYARGALRARMDRGLRRHLERCVDCRSAALGTRDVCERLRLLLPVAVVGWGAGVYSGGAAGAAEAAVDGVADTVVGTSVGVSLGTSLGIGVAAPSAVPVEGSAGVMGAVGPVGTDGAAGGGATVFEGLGATAKAGVTAGVMAAAVATALTLALVADGQRSRGPQPESRPSTASVPGAPGGEAADSKAGGSEPLTVMPSQSAGGSTDRTLVRPPGTEPAPAPESGSPSAPGSGPNSVPGPGPSLPGSTSPTGGTPAPTPPASPAPTASTVHRLDRLPRDSSGADRPTVRGGESDRMWQRSDLRVGGRNQGPGVTVAARSTLTIDLDRSCTAFDALVGVDDLTVVPAAVRFSVYGDGVRLWRSGVVRRGDAPVPVHVSLSGRGTLRLVVEPRTPLDAVALADWAQARITCG